MQRLMRYRTELGLDSQLPILWTGEVWLVGSGQHHLPVSFRQRLIGPGTSNHGN